ncbi:MFS transporter [Enterococcus sp. CWB-B31]|uniref:MFS transporter n=1 Tax=Enterococcus sp. CWB-B31 TaxID=2885159 RepID=UPI001E4348C9|nr:MFS transporter [Enterococcus sp. CWB-B31]MCB5954804.1 MFS transporter [Enterococcus sp. CWB-B31]
MSLGKDRYSLMLSVNSLLILLFQFPALYFLKKQSALKLIALSNCLFAVSLLFVAQSADWFFCSLMVISYSLAEVLLGSNFDYLIDSFADEKNKGFFFGLLEIVKAGTTIGPVIGGVLIEKFSKNSFSAVFLFLSIITLTEQIFLWIYSKKEAIQ